MRYRIFHFSNSPTEFSLISAALLVLFAFTVGCEGGSAESNRLAPTGTGSGSGASVAFDFEKDKGAWDALNGRISLVFERENVRVGRGSLEWNYVNRANEYCLIYTKSLPTQFLAATGHISFWVKSSREGYLALRVDEKDGSSYVYYAMITENTWQAIDVEPSLFTLTADGRDENNRLDFEQISVIYLIDPSGASGEVLGPRTVWIDDLRFGPMPAELSYQGKVRIYGQVKGEKDKTVSGVQIIVYDYGAARGWTWETWPVLGKTVTRSDGRYELLVPPAKSYVIGCYSSYWSVENASYLYNYMPEQIWVQHGGGSIEQSFDLIPAGNLVLYGYDESGSMISHGRLTKMGSLGGILAYASDGTFKSLPAIYRPVSKNKDDIENTIPNLVVPLNTPSRVNVMFWTVPKAGKFLLQADGAGDGFVISSAGGFRKVDLNLEFARTKVLEAQRRLKEVRGVAKIEKATAEIVDELGRELSQVARLKPSSRRIRALQDILARAIYVCDDLVLAKATADISGARQGSVIVAIQDEKDQPVRNAQISYRQISHDFLFGFAQTLGFVLNDEMKPDEMSEDQKRDLFFKMKDAGLNLFKVGLFWDELQGGPDSYKFGQWDKKLGLSWARESGFKFFGHGIVQSQAPKFFYEKSFAQQLLLLQKHLDKTIDYYQEQYPGTFLIWNIFNEPASSGLFGPQKFTKEQVIEFVDVVAKTARSKTNNSKLLINHGNLFWDMGVQYQVKNHPHFRQGFYFVSPLSIIELLDKSKIDYDLIGYEHYPGAHVENPWVKIEDICIDFSRTSDLLDALASFGKGVHITEFSVPGDYKSGWTSGYWRRKWDPQIQAEFLRKFYTLAFSRPEIHEITWWGGSDREQWNVKGGLLDEHNNPKPVYHALKSLISSWTTSGITYTDTEGKVRIRGFAGRYELSVGRTGKKLRRELHIQERKLTQHTIRLTDSLVTGRLRQVSEQK